MPPSDSRSSQDLPHQPPFDFDSQPENKETIKPLDSLNDTIKPLVDSPQTGPAPTVSEVSSTPSKEPPSIDAGAPPLPFPETPFQNLNATQKDQAVTSSFKPNPLTPQNTSSSAPQSQTILPTSSTRIGRFLIQKELGKGAYGTVYLCNDEELKRTVAIKVPHPELLIHSGFREDYFKESQILAQMKHPSIVEVLEISKDPFFLVSNFIEGCSLEAKMKQGRMSFVEIAHLIEAIAKGLQHAHSKGLVHRDLKPANILIDLAGKPHIADFGMALHDDDFGKGKKRTGTPLYNSPEQARSEGHRVDGRSDLFSLGIILYELLTVRHPFLRGKPTREELFRLIIEEDPKPPQQFDGLIPKSLSLICGKCLAKDLKERYQSGQELADDLAQYFAIAGSAGELQRLKATPDPEELSASVPLDKTTVSDLDQIHVVPKGLRSFEKEDATFFLALLPGARRLDGLPESIHFWKTRIERKEDTFSVGLIFGPSGCGKSSLVKAGLLPGLDCATVVSGYLEAAPGLTEKRLLEVFRNLALNLPEGVSLKEAGLAIRQGSGGIPSGKKALIVIDQFEQWLYERQGKFPGDLTDALRQFDGVHAQCILLVRDDFSMPIKRFMRHLEIDLVPDRNEQVADLFDKFHATKVLLALGRGYGRIAPFPTEPTADQKLFLKLAIDGLAQEERVISVRLAMFAQMMKSREWTPASLKDVGGVEGLGISFLEETFGKNPIERQAVSLRYRTHQKAAQGVLKALMPEVGTDIKGQMRSPRELQTAAGYDGQPVEFAELLTILDREIRLITPIDPEGQSAEKGDNKQSGQYYQLAHDYLVPSIRDWLRRKQNESAKGRAEILLEERAALWKEKKQSRHLPSLPEYLRIAWHTKPFERTQTQKEMVGQAGWFHGIRALLVFLVTGVFSLVAYESYQRFRADSLINQLVKAKPGEIMGLVSQIAPYSAWADGRLEAIRQTQGGASEALAASIAILPRKPEIAGELVGQLTTVSNDQFEILTEALKSHADLLKENLWSAVLIELDADKRFRMAAALAVLDPDGPNWDKITEFLSEYLTGRDATNYLFWRKQLTPVGTKLVSPLEKQFQDPKVDQQVRAFAVEAAIEYSREKPETLYRMMVESPSRFYHPLQKACLDQVEACSKLAKEELSKPIPDKLTEDQKDSQAMLKANAAIFLLKANQADQKIWDLWKISPDPRIRSEIIHDCPLLGIDPLILIRRLEQETEISTRRALVLSLGSYPETKFPEVEKNRLMDLFLKEFATHPDGGYHSALEWVLRQWGQGDKVEVILKDLSGKYPKKSQEEKDWLVTPAGITMMVIKPGSFSMGSGEPGLAVEEETKTVKIPRPFLLATHEVTWGLFRQFEKEINRPLLADNKALLPFLKTEMDPQIGIDWFGAARFCNWLSEKEGIPKEEWCYEPVKVTDPKNDNSGGYREGMIIKANHRSLAGYRLPLETEWEYACRATTKTSRYYGNRHELLGQYAKYVDNSANHLWPVHSLKPNDWGLFGMLGNALEWSSDNYQKEISETEMEKITKDTRWLRGGSFNGQASNSRSSYRSDNQPDSRVSLGGFRPARTYDLRFFQGNGK